MTTVFRTPAAHARFGSSHVRSHLRRGLWQQPERGVIVTHNAALTAPELVEVALAIAAPRSAVAGLASLALDGFESPMVAPTDIVLPEGARRPTTAVARFHVSTELTDHDVHPARTPRRTRPARSVIDAASWATTDIAARSIVLAATRVGADHPRGTSTPRPVQAAGSGRRVDAGRLGRHPVAARTRLRPDRG